MYPNSTTLPLPAQLHSHDTVVSLSIPLSHHRPDQHPQTDAHAPPPDASGTDCYAYVFVDYHQHCIINNKARPTLSDLAQISVPVCVS